MKAREHHGKHSAQGGLANTRLAKDLKSMSSKMRNNFLNDLEDIGLDGEVVTAARVPSLAKESNALWTSLSFQPCKPSPLMLRWIRLSWSCPSMCWSPLLALCLLAPFHQISKPFPFTKRSTYCPSNSHQRGSCTIPWGKEGSPCSVVVTAHPTTQMHKTQLINLSWFLPLWPLFSHARDWQMHGLIHRKVRQRGNQHLGGKTFSMSARGNVLLSFHDGVHDIVRWSAKLGFQPLGFDGSSHQNFSDASLELLKGSTGEGSDGLPHFFGF